MSLKFKIVIVLVMVSTSLLVFFGLMEKSGLLNNEIENENGINEEDVLYKEELEKQKLEKFEAKTITGKQISNAVFADYDLTMVNIWATFCRPCVDEMDELDALYKSLPKGVNLITICWDGESKLELAKQILEANNTTFDTVIANKDMIYGVLKNYFSFPTTIFINRDGELVGEAMVGAPRYNVVETYNSEINRRLKGQ